MNKELNKKYTSIESLISDEELIASLSVKQREQFKRRIRNNLLHSLSIEKKINHSSQDICIRLKYLYQENSIGSATCYKKNDQEKITLNTLYLYEMYHNYGLGTHVFHCIMKELHELFPTITRVEWTAIPLFFKAKNPDNEAEEWEKAQKRLFKFYKNCGATVNEETGDCYINLKDAEYFDEN